MMEDYLIVFYKWKSHSEQKRIAASMPIKAYNDGCAYAVAAAICVNMPFNWTYEVEKVQS